MKKITMQNEFKFLKCIDVEGSCGFLHEGGIYSYIPPSDGYMYFIEELGSYWSCDRFEPVEKEFKDVNLYDLCGIK